MKYSEKLSKFPHFMFKFEPRNSSPFSVADHHVYNTWGSEKRGVFPRFMSKFESQTLSLANHYVYPYNACNIRHCLWKNCFEKCWALICSYYRYNLFFTRIRRKLFPRQKKSSNASHPYQLQNLSINMSLSLVSFFISHSAQTEEWLRTSPCQLLISRSIQSINSLLLHFLKI